MMYNEIRYTFSPRITKTVIHQKLIIIVESAKLDSF